MACRPRWTTTSSCNRSNRPGTPTPQFLIIRNRRLKRMHVPSPRADVFLGDFVYPDDSRYPTLVRGFNLRWVGAPSYVALCGDTDQVVKAVQKALDEGHRITFRGGGHCYENFVCENRGGVIIDLSPMGDVYLDPQNGWYCVEGGATL